MSAAEKGKLIQPPYLPGKPLDSRTIKIALVFLGMMLAISLISFIFCSVTGGSGHIIRIPVNIAIIVLILYLHYGRGLQQGTEDVRRGEILLQRLNRNEEISAAEQEMCFHRAKGWTTALVGSIPILILSLMLALTATRQMTGCGTIPSWMEPYLRRSEIGGALSAYIQTDPISVTEILRIVIRLLIMPFIQLIGPENKDALLLAERLSPMILLLPATAYGIGYPGGVKARAQLHTAIATNDRKRIRREKATKRKQNAQKTDRGPKQLN